MELYAVDWSKRLPSKWLRKGVGHGEQDHSQTARDRRALHAAAGPVPVPGCGPTQAAPPHSGVQAGSLLPRRRGSRQRPRRMSHLLLGMINNLKKKKNSLFWFWFWFYKGFQNGLISLKPMFYFIFTIGMSAAETGSRESAFTLMKELSWQKGIGGLFDV